MKALVGAFNQEKALVGAFSVIVQLGVEPMDRFTALVRLLRLHNQQMDCQWWTQWTQRLSNLTTILWYYLRYPSPYLNRLAYTLLGSLRHVHRNKLSDSHSSGIQVFKNGSEWIQHLKFHFLFRWTTVFWLEDSSRSCRSAVWTRIIGWGMRF